MSTPYPEGHRSALYQDAERAAEWMARGDDFDEAKAVRQLITEHQALTIQRDDLLAELKRLVRAVEDGSDESIELVASYALIAKVEGGSK